ncbi:hypothetical protein [Sphingobacterium sp. LRF_L2]|uniref:hypothetical protein n=1 Tax=Sphingobacterium sp. LRF_L2 TaxID=3369421 RepID=UPI003F5DDD6E
MLTCENITKGIAGLFVLVIKGMNELPPVGYAGQGSTTSRSVDGMWWIRWGSNIVWYEWSYLFYRS